MAALGLDGRTRGNGARPAHPVRHRISTKSRWACRRRCLGLGFCGAIYSAFKAARPCRLALHPHPNVDRPEPPLEHVDSAFLQRVQEIHVTDKGHAALAARQKSDGGAQINTVGAPWTAKNRTSAKHRHHARTNQRWLALRSSRNRKRCGRCRMHRLVVVDFETGEGDPSPRGIVTSFNEVK